MRLTHHVAYGSAVHHGGENGLAPHSIIGANGIALDRTRGTPQANEVAFSRRQAGSRKRARADRR
jgi:hypothetical protein